MSEPSDPGKPVFRELTGRIGKYEIERLIGKGAMGHVYRARDTVLDRRVALKVMAAQIADDPELKQRFEREARAVARMTHPNVVTVFELGTLPEGAPFIAMELLEGKDLQKTLRQPGAMTLERKVAVIAEVLVGLAHAHRAGVVHRDIKPANIFIQKDGSVKIMDFGVAHLSAHTMTADGNIVGTADYMSPEQVKGGKATAQSDLFSVGCMLFELVAGRRPFHADNLMAIFYKITHERASFELLPRGPEYDALRGILKKALAKNVDERYQNADEFEVDLRGWLRARGTTDGARRALEPTVGLEAPTHVPPPTTEAPAATVPGEGRASATGTVDLGEGHLPPGRQGLSGPTQVSERTVVEARGAAAPASGVSRAAPAAPVARAAPRSRRARRPSPLPWVLAGVGLVAAAGAAAFLSWKGQHWKGRQETPRPPTTLAAVPPTTQAPPPTTLATPAPPPVTAAPQPRFDEAKGKAAAAVRTAQAAFKRGDYDRAVGSAQQALREEADNPQARDVLARALEGQKAVGRLQGGSAALDRGDLDGADREAQAAYDIAPWDQGVAELKRKIDATRLRAAEQEKREHTAEVNRLLDQGTTALQNKQYDAAVAAFERALELDPGNAAAQNGKTGAASAKAVAEAAAGGPPAPPAHAFVAGTTVARSPHDSAGDTPSGFLDTPEVEVKKASQAAALPGKLLFEASPDSPKAGDAYSVSAYLLNEGSQPIELATMVVTTIIDGGRSQGRVSPMVSVVAPRTRALVFKTPRAVWKQETTSWSMEIVVHTSQSETYQNSLTWK